MFSRLRKLPLVVLSLLVVLALSACGSSHTRVTTGTYAGEAGDAAPYLYVGPLIYEVQVSRELNPFNAEDAAYLHGVSASESKLEPGEEWFAVFIQVYNNTSQEQLAASDLKVYDTQGNTYSPIALEQSNLFAYRGGAVPAKGQLPLPGTIADDVSPQGALLLFKIQLASLENRPLKLKIVDPLNPAESASAELDT
jgi:hypothetical protein